MQIHELNNFTGTLGSGSFLAVDNGTDTGKLSTQQLLAGTEARIDNIIAGPAPSAEEIVDARLGADGVTYPSLGDAIRDQFTDVKSDLKVNDGIAATAFGNKVNRSISFTEPLSITANGTLSDFGSVFKHTKLIPVKYGEAYKISGFAYYAYNFRVHGYTASANDETYDTSTWVKQLTWFATENNKSFTTTVVIDDASIKYLRLSGVSDSTVSVSIYGDDLDESIYDTISEEVRDSVTEDYTDTSLWEQGTFSGETPTSSTTRIRTVDYFSSSDFLAMKTPSSYECVIVAWNKSSGAYIGTWGANGTAFVTEGASTWVKEFDFSAFPSYKFRIAMRNAVNTSATVAISEAVNCAFKRYKFVETSNRNQGRTASYLREYSDITSSIVYQNKTIDEVNGITNSTTEVIAELPSSGNVEVRMRYNTTDNEFAIYQVLNGVTTKLCDFTHYEFRYTGDYSPKYYVRVKTADTSASRDFTMKHCLVVYKYCDHGFNYLLKTILFGKKIAVFGDSIVQGKVRKNSATDVNSVTCKPWSGLIAEATGNFNPKNFGIGGATVANTGTSLYPDWKSLYTRRNEVSGFDYVFICAGVNDFGADVAEATFKTAYGTVLDALIANNTNVVVVTPCARSTSYANGVGLRVSDYADFEKAIATAKNLQYIDLFAQTDNTLFKSQLPDGLHPNEIGHQMIANIILDAYSY